MNPPTLPVTLPDEFRLGRWRVLRDQNRLESLDDPAVVVKVEPKAMDVLCLLASHAPQTLSRAQLLDTVWAGRVVVEGTLSRAIRQLRIALDDDVRAPVYIETVSKRGYRLLLQPLMAHRPAMDLAAAMPEEPAALPIVAPVVPQPVPGARRPRPLAIRGWLVAASVGVLALLGVLVQSGPPSSRAARVLWVDDRPGNNQREIARLQSMGVRVETAGSNAEAAQRLQSRRYDLLISDIKRSSEAGLPGLSLPREALPDRNRLPPVVYYVRKVGAPRTADGYPVTDDPEHLVALVSELAGVSTGLRPY